MKISISDFAGVAPKMTPASLPPNAAQTASNARLYAGALQPTNIPLLVSSQVVDGATSLYMLGPQGGQIPLAWVNDVDVVASPIADSEYKVYYSGDGLPKKTSLTLATGGGAMPASWYYLSVETPANAPTLSATTGSVPAGTYAYVYTYVTQFGSTLLEEGVPSAAGTITLGSTGGVSLTLLTNPPGTTNRNYVYKRIYRTTGSTYQMVAQIAWNTTTHTDNLAPASIPGDALLTAAWLPPKDDFAGFCALPGGVIAAFRNNEVWFSEPGYPHAWPVAYMQTVGAAIVGLKSFNNTLVVTTTGPTYAADGYHPSSFTFSKLALWEPCVSKRSMAADENGVVYASQNGLVGVRGSGIGVVTASALSRAAFAAFAPETISAVLFDGRYYGFYELNGGPVGAIVFAPADGDKLITQTWVRARGATVDSYTARMLFIDGGTGMVHEYDPAGSAPTSFEWKSKRYTTPVPTSFGCVRVTSSAVYLAEDYFDGVLATYNAAVAAANATILATTGARGAVSQDELGLLELNGSVLQQQIISVLRKVAVTVWADNVLILSATATPNSVLRLPSGFLARDWEIGVSGAIEVLDVSMATSPTELV